MNKNVTLKCLLCALTCFFCFTAQPSALAVKVKVEVEVGEDSSAKPSKKPVAKETFPVTLRNKTGYKMFVALLYYDGNSKNWRSRGWWGVEPGKERSFKLSHVPGKSIYYYVERGGNAFSPSGTEKGVNRNVTKDCFSYLDGQKVKLNNSYRAHFEHGGTGHDGWWALTVNS